MEKVVKVHHSFEESDRRTTGDIDFVEASAENAQRLADVQIDFGFGGLDIAT